MSDIQLPRARAPFTIEEAIEGARQHGREITRESFLNLVKKGMFTEVDTGKYVPSDDGTMFAVYVAQAQQFIVPLLIEEFTAEKTGEKVTGRAFSTLVKSLRDHGVNVPSRYLDQVTFFERLTFSVGYGRNKQNRRCEFVSGPRQDLRGIIS